MTMTEPNKADEVALKLEKFDMVYDYFRSLDQDEATASMLAKAYQDDFSWNSVRLTYGKDRKSVTDPSVAEHYRITLPNIFKKPEPEKKAGDTAAPEVDPALIASALAGNYTAKSRVLLALGLDVKSSASKAQVEAFLDAERIKANGGNAGHDRDTAGRFTAPADTTAPADLKAANGSNPWNVASFNVTRQAQIFRADPALAARLAKAAGSAIGATKNMRTALAPALRRA